MMDDFVAIMLDGLGNRQTSYEFFINPHGIQMDAVDSAVSGMDVTPDFVWESAGKLTPDGYQVEVRIPLDSIRYQKGKGKDKEVQMGVLFYRSVTHLGMAGCWPELQPGQTIFNGMSKIIYQGLKKSGLRLEILPNFTVVHDAMASLLEYGMMVSPIHTRRIVDPGWAVKLSGSSGESYGMIVYRKSY